MPIIEDDIRRVEKKFANLDGQRKSLLRTRQTKVSRLTEVEQEIGVVQEAKQLLEMFVRSTETSIKDFLEPIVTESLEFVFEQYLKFHLVFSQRRNQVEVDFVILRSESVEKEFVDLMDTDPESKKLETIIKESKNINFMYGGAINQVLGLVLRIVLFNTLGVRGPLVLDEPSSAVSANYNSRLGHLISSLSERLGIQIVLITHSSELASFAKKTYTISKTAGTSKAVESPTSD